MENVMAVPTAALAPYLRHRGLIRGLDASFLALIREAHVFLPRSVAEADPAHKQIIPYVTLTRGDEVYLLRRLKKGGETRLRGLLSLGAGGHIDDTDGGRDPLQSGLARELSEELFLTEPGTPQLLGIINDDTTEVGRVHLGLFFTLEVSDASVRETEKLSGEWRRRRDLPPLVPEMETWSQIALEALLD